MCEAGAMPNRSGALKRASDDVVVSRPASDSLRRGHPWIWRSAVLRGLDGVAAGAVVRIVGQDGVLLGRGIADPESPIAVRVWVTGEATLDDALIDRRLALALGARARLFRDGATTAYRLVHGEGDRMPGLVVDRYGTVAVAKLDGAGAEGFGDVLLPRLWEALRSRGVESLVLREGKGSASARTTHGSPPPATIEVQEHGVRFVVDLARGQKTGAFLDQRENRRRVGEIVTSLGHRARVLNLFSYAGGFSLRAALAGAERVTSVDIAAGAHATAQASFKVAGVAAKDHEFVTADAFAFLAEAKKAKRAWDVVVSDPPSFAPSEKALPRALQAYRALHGACAGVLAPGGVFCAASCSSHVDAEAFASTLDDAALGRSDLRMHAMHGPGPDHPTLPAWPEGRYLKFAVLA
jgi:23S rRNA (cytosine1962-C5)-methyltransferase